jgi:hypothetical protein
MYTTKKKTYKVGKQETTLHATKPYWQSFSSHIGEQQLQRFTRFTRSSLFF